MLINQNPRDGDVIMQLAGAIFLVISYAKRILEAMRTQVEEGSIDRKYFLFLKLK